MAATVSIERRGAGIELHRGLFAVELDGYKMDGLRAAGDSTQLQVEPGVHRLRISSGRYASRELQFEAHDGSDFTFLTHGAGISPRYLISLAVPRLGISLHRG